MGAMGAVGAVGLAMGAGNISQCDRSRRAAGRGRISSGVADSLATLEARLWRLERSS